MQHHLRQSLTSIDGLLFGRAEVIIPRTTERYRPDQAAACQLRNPRSGGSRCDLADPPALKAQCTTGPERRISRWEHEAVLEKVQDQLDHNPNAMGVRRQTAEHPFGTIKCWMGATHFLTKRLPKVATEMAPDPIFGYWKFIEQRLALEISAFGVRFAIFFARDRAPGR
jgi:hypothetical protein